MNATLKPGSINGQTSSAESHGIQSNVTFSGSIPQTPDNNKGKKRSLPSSQESDAQKRQKKDPTKEVSPESSHIQVRAITTSLTPKLHSQNNK